MAQDSFCPGSWFRRVLFCHATPRNENEIFTRLTRDDPLMAVFAGVKASVVVCGHTHMQFDRVVGGVRVVNAGSVGMPFGKTGADWLILGPKFSISASSLRFDESCRAYPPNKLSPSPGVC